MAQPVRIKCPLGDDVFELQSMSGEERLGTPFRYELQLMSSQHDVAGDALLGQPLTVSVQVVDRAERHYHGIVTQFRYLGSEGRHSRYGVTLRPWLFLLTRSAQSRIFQNQSVPDIIKAVFRGHGFSDFSEQLTGSYAPREYCVQYRESDFNFVSRLMEHEGIYYFVEHEAGKHTLVLMDAESVHDPVPGYEELPLRRAGADATDHDPSFTAWSASDAVQAGAYTLRDYDFRKPNADLTVRAAVSQGFPYGDLEVYDYPGRYEDCGVGEKQARKRIEALKAQRTVCSGTHSALGLFTGAAVKLIDHPRASANGEYLVTGQHFELIGGTYESGHSNEVRFSCEAALIERTTSFVPPRQTPTPTVQGPQTATVAGGGEVWTDAYGRVKLKFHWDREGTGDAQSSCWVRVSQNSASSGWGSMYIPHVGDEVIVDFLEGDPDQPIVTGRVYNANKMPPLALPANDKKSILRDHYGNELIFDGTAGSEHITLHSPSKFSVLQLGKSVRTFTGSTNVSCTLKSTLSYTIGDSATFARGHSFSLTRGGWFNVKMGAGADIGLGAQISVWGGVKASFSAGVSFDVSKTSKVTFTYDNQWNVAKGTLSVRAEKDVLIDSEKKVRITGGKKDRTLILVDHDNITLSVDPSSSGRSMALLSGKAKAWAGAATAILAAGAGLGTWAYGAQIAKKTEKTNGTTLEIDAEVGQLEAFTKADLGTLAGVVGGIGLAALVGKPSDAPSPDHSKPTGAIQVKSNNVLLSTGKGKETTLQVSGKQGIDLKSNRSIGFEADKGVKLKTKQTIHVVGKKLDLHGTMVKHKNITILS
ncbi:MAG: type VI secretion system tip protein TssI/VgrG [Polyangiales bacterium]